MLFKVFSCVKVLIFCFVLLGLGLSSSLALDVHINSIGCGGCHNTHGNMIPRPTCESCHINGSHPNLKKDPFGNPKVDAEGRFIFEKKISAVLTQDIPVPNPQKAHSPFPTFHFQTLSCFACHEPYIEDPNDIEIVQKTALKDFSVNSTYPRTQTELEIAGPVIRPAYVWWRNGKLYPALLETELKWVEVYPLNSGDVDPYTAVSLCGLPTDSTTPQNGDTALALNTWNELDCVFNTLTSYYTNWMGGTARPNLYLTINPGILTHRIFRVSEVPPLGSPKNGGCLNCHSSDDPTSPNYSPYSYGFFTGLRPFFKPPVDGGKGLVMYNDSQGIKRIKIFIQRTFDDWGLPIPGTAEPIMDYLGANDTIPNVVSNRIWLETNFSNDYLNGLESPGIAGIQRPVANFYWQQEDRTSYSMDFDASTAICPSGNCTYEWDFDGDGAFDISSSILVDNTVIMPSWAYASAGTYDVTLMLP